jgi:Fe-S-cluster containining protein
MKKLGYPQYLQFLKYLDCKKRTKKHVGLPNYENLMSDDEKLVRFLLENSSITECNGERSFHRICEAIDLMCKQLCPGQWCTHYHCQYYRSKKAYNCMLIRPKICKEYTKYMERKKERNEKLKDNKVQ